MSIIDRSVNWLITFKIKSISIYQFIQESHFHSNFDLFSQKEKISSNLSSKKS